MRKWQNLAAPNDPGSWYDCYAMWPTRRGTYETADISSLSTTQTVASAYVVAFAYAFGVSSGVPQEYVIFQATGGAVKVYEWDGTSWTSRLSVSSATAAVGFLHCVRYGSDAYVAIGQSHGIYKTGSGFGSAFSAVSGSPANANILIVQSNALLAFQTGNNTWYASDVGDPTNWSTGEYATASINGSAGTVSTAVAHGNDVYVFKPGAVHRMTYVGGVVKWQVQKVLEGYGVPAFQMLSSKQQPVQDHVISTPHGIVFYGGGGLIYLWDTVSEPRCLNPLTTIPVETIQGVFVYDHIHDILCVAPSKGSSAAGAALVDNSSSTFTSLYYYYNFAMDAWGSGAGSDDELQVTTGQPTCSGVLRGPWTNRAQQTSPKPTYWNGTDITSGTFKRVIPADPGSSSSCYLQSSMFGKPDRKTNFFQCTPLLRRRTSLGSASAALSLTTWRELSDTAAQTTNAVTESTLRQRFDFNYTDNFARSKVTWAALDVEVDDFLIGSQDAGAN